MTMLAFDEKIAAQLESLYRSRDVLHRRQLVRAALRAQPGERILDIGCGPGFYVDELREEVGPQGAVVGLDRSPQMLAAATGRCRGHANVGFREGEATCLPIDDWSFDAAIAVQVLEYVADVGEALSEMRRVLKPGGRLVLWDIDWSTLSWHSRDPARMERVLRAWDSHLSHPALPRTLAARLRSADFENISVEGHTFATIQPTPDTYVGAVLPLMHQFVGSRPEIGEEQANAWAKEQRQLAERGEFFFACIQFCFTATRARR
ncbi:MAG TPA: methyltransferase domain-containing protein [Gemmatimonadales bacterium]|jgi:ubiquinone/menaquinone biosynthesis C-methylase UbiE